MKRIINGKLYNTETGRRIGVWESHSHQGDFNYYAESLYITKNGQYFLHGEGGPLSKYSRPCGTNGRCSGEQITLFTDQDARQWAELSLSADQYMEHFGDVEEG